MDDGEMGKQTTDRMKGVFADARRVFEAGEEARSRPMSWARRSRRVSRRWRPRPYARSHVFHSVVGLGQVCPVRRDQQSGVFVRNPGWQPMFDQDPDVAVATRRKVYDMLVADKMLVQGFHYPFPGLARVEKAGNGYRLIQAPWSPV